MEGRGVRVLTCLLLLFAPSSSSPLFLPSSSSSPLFLLLLSLPPPLFPTDPRRICDLGCLRPGRAGLPPFMLPPLPFMHACSQSVSLSPVSYTHLTLPTICSV
eukprot:2801520-Rhodomonas_salina.1